MLVPVIVGIVGGIGSGKSTVTRLLVELGAEAIDADAIAHEVLEEDDVQAALRSWWGERVFRPDGRVDREAVARTVFGDAEERRRLEALVHPRILDRIEGAVRAFRESPRSEERWLVLDVPLLASSPLESLCDAIVFIDAPRGMRAERVRRRGWSSDELERREAAQVPLETKRQAATHVLVNANGIEAIRPEVERLYRSLTTTPTRGND